MKTKQERIAELKEQIAELKEQIAKIEAEKLWERTRTGYAIFEVENHPHNRFDACSTISFLTRENATEEMCRASDDITARNFIIDSWNNFGELPDWKNEKQIKFCIILITDSIFYGNRNTEFQTLHFPSTSSRESFRALFDDEKLTRLIKGVW